MIIAPSYLPMALFSIVFGLPLFLLAAVFLERQLSMWTAARILQAEAYPGRSYWLPLSYNLATNLGLLVAAFIGAFVGLWYGALAVLLAFLLPRGIGFARYSGEGISNRRVLSASGLHALAMYLLMVITNDITARVLLLL